MQPRPPIGCWETVSIRSSMLLESLWGVGRLPFRHGHRTCPLTRRGALGQAQKQQAAGARHGKKPGTASQPHLQRAPFTFSNSGRIHTPPNWLRSAARGPSALSRSSVGCGWASRFRTRCVQREFGLQSAPRARRRSGSSGGSRSVGHSTAQRAPAAGMERRALFLNPQGTLLPGWRGSDGRSGAFASAPRPSQRRAAPRRPAAGRDGAGTTVAATVLEQQAAARVAAAAAAATAAQQALAREQHRQEEIIHNHEVLEHLIEESLDHRAALCDSGLPDPDMCLIPEAEEEPPPHVPVRGVRGLPGGGGTGAGGVLAGPGWTRTARCRRGAAGCRGDACRPWPGQAAGACGRVAAHAPRAWCAPSGGSSHTQRGPPRPPPLCPPTPADHQRGGLARPLAGGAHGGAVAQQHYPGPLLRPAAGAPRHHAVPDHAVSPGLIGAAARAGAALLRVCCGGGPAAMLHLGMPC
jgi:hypothetical protein